MTVRLSNASLLRGSIFTNVRLGRPEINVHVRLAGSVLSRLHSQSTPKKSTSFSVDSVLSRLHSQSTPKKLKYSSQAFAFGPVMLLGGVRSNIRIMLDLIMPHSLFELQPSVCIRHT